MLTVFAVVFGAVAILCYFIVSFFATAYFYNLRVLRLKVWGEGFPNIKKYIVYISPASLISV